MHNSAHPKSLRLKSLVVISAIFWIGITSTTLSADNAKNLPDPAPENGATKQATFSMY